MIDYMVALPSSNWPTVQALQECLGNHGWPVKLCGTGYPHGEAPLAAVTRTLGLPVLFNGEPIALEASFITLGAAEAVDLNERLKLIGAQNVHFQEMDRILRLTFRVTIEEYQAGFYILAALIKCFGGYGFQGDRHGALDFADYLVAEAVRLASEGPTQVTEEHMQFMRNSLIALAEMASKKS